MRTLFVGPVGVEFHVFVDEVPHLTSYGRPDEYLLNARNWLISAGGSVAFGSVVASSLGVETSALYCLGNDEIGARITETLASYNINLFSIIREGQTNSFLSIHDRFSNRILYVYRRLRLIESDITKQVLHGHDLVVIYPVCPGVGLHAARLAKSCGLKVAFCPNPSFLDNKEVFRCVLELVDFLFLNEKEVKMYSGMSLIDEGYEHFAKYGSFIQVITLAEKGCLVFGKFGERFSVPGFRVQAVNSAGAGDSFAAAFLSRYFQCNDLVSAAVFANAVGACVVTKHNPIENPFTLSEVEDLMKRGHQ